MLAATYTSPTFVAAHTVAVDTSRALLILNGTRSDNGLGGYPFAGLQIFSLATPEAPSPVSVWPATGPYDGSNYVHDSAPVGNRLYLASVYTGEVRELDTTNPASPALTTSWTYPGAFYTHNSWPDGTGGALYVTDEQNGQTLRVFDIQNLGSPSLVTGVTSNPKAIVHNAHVRGGELFLSNYTEGIRVLDLSDPLHPAEFGWADTYPGPSGGYSRVWEVCPDFPSGIAIASDMQSGLWVLLPVRDYGVVRVTVLDAGTQQPLAGARVRLTTQGDSLTTFADGVVSPPVATTCSQLCSGLWNHGAHYADLSDYAAPDKR